MPKITLIGIETRETPVRDRRGNAIDGEYTKTVVLHYTHRLVRDGSSGLAAGNITVFNDDAQRLPALHVGKPYLLDCSEQNHRMYFRDIEPLFDDAEPFKAELTDPESGVKDEKSGAGRRGRDS